MFNLEGLGAYVNSTTIAVLSSAFLGGYDLGASGQSWDGISGLAISQSGNTLYAVNQSGSNLFVVDLLAPELDAQLDGFHTVRGGSLASYENQAYKVAVRPGIPGVHFQGPSVFVGLINLTPNGASSRDVALDAVTVDRQ